MSFRAPTKGGHREVPSITIGENESAKFWKAVLNELKTIYPAPDEQSGHARMEAIAATRIKNTRAA
ncbi:MAG: hypothetical protein RR933_06025 [Oscillospiraceae bacterium]